MKPELLVHRVLAAGDDRAHQLAGPALGAALAPGVVARHDLRRSGSARRHQPPAGAREEDDALGVARDLGEVANHAPPRAASRRRVGTAASHPLVELAAKGLATRRSSSSETSGSPSARRTSPCPGFMRTSFTRFGLCQRPGALRGGRAEDVDRARRPAPSSRRPWPTACAAISLRPAGGVGQLLPAREEGGERRGVSAARAVRGAGREARALDPQACRAPSIQRVGPVLGVAAGDDHGVGARAPEPSRRARPASRPPPPRPATGPPRGSGVTTVARGRIRSISAALAFGSRSARAALGDHHRVHDDRRLAHQPERLRDRVDRRLVGQHPDLHGVDADVGGDGAGPGPRSSRAEPARPARRPPCSAR